VPALNDDADGTPSTNVMRTPTKQAAAPIPTAAVSMSNGPNIMQGPPTPTTGQAEAPIPPETLSNGSDMNGAVTNSRKVAKRSLPWDLRAGELLVSQDEDNPAKKKPRLGDTLPTPGTDTQPNAGAGTRATGSWTLEEDAQLTSAMSNTSKMKWGEEYKTDFDAVAALVPGRTQRQCRDRWKDALDPNIDRSNGRRGKWTAVEDSKLKDAVQTHGGKDWAAISALVPGRTRIQCKSRWHDPSADGRSGGWTEDEDSKLKNAVQTHGGKDWDAISAFVPGRTRKQSWSRWHYALDSSIDQMLPTKRTGT
jgi:hypothetical protein